MQQPEQVIEWQDPYSPAKGCLVINALINGACGGGTRVSLTTNVQELTRLAQIMQQKFAVFGPAIGGAKAGIVMNPNDPNKYAVLKRWFEYIKPILLESYGTASDLHTDFSAIQSCLQSIDIPHPQYGIIKALKKTPAAIQQTLTNMQVLDKPVSVATGIDVPLAQLVTGYLIAELIALQYQQQQKCMVGKKAFIQGVGTVGSAAAYYLQQKGVKVVAVLDQQAGIIDAQGIGKVACGALLQTLSISKTFANTLSHDVFYQQLQDQEINIFIPAAGSELVGKDLIAALLEQQLEIVLSGANIPYKKHEEQDILQLLNERQVATLPAYIASGGMACAFGVLLKNHWSVVNSEMILQAVQEQINHARTSSLLVLQ